MAARSEPEKVLPIPKVPDEVLPTPKVKLGGGGAPAGSTSTGTKTGKESAHESKFEAFYGLLGDYCVGILLK